MYVCTCWGLTFHQFATALLTVHWWSDDFMLRDISVTSFQDPEPVLPAVKFPPPPPPLPLFPHLPQRLPSMSERRITSTMAAAVYSVCWKGTFPKTKIIREE